MRKAGFLQVSEDQIPRENQYAEVPFWTILVYAGFNSVYL